MGHFPPPEFTRFSLDAPIPRADTGGEVGRIHVASDSDNASRHLHDTPQKIQISSDSVEWLESAQEHLLRPLLTDLATQMTAEEKTKAEERMQDPKRESYVIYSYNDYRFEPVLDKEGKRLHIIATRQLKTAEERGFSHYTAPADPEAYVAILQTLRDHSKLVSNELVFQAQQRLLIGTVSKYIRHVPDRGSIGFYCNYDIEKSFQEWRDQRMYKDLQPIMEQLADRLMSSKQDPEEHQYAIMMIGYGLIMLSRADIVMNGLYASPKSFDIAGEGFSKWRSEYPPDGLPVLDTAHRQSIVEHCQDIIRRTDELIREPDPMMETLKDIEKRLNDRGKRGRS